LCSGAGGWTHSRRFRSGLPRRFAEEVKTRMEKLGPGGGFVFNAIHNVQARVPVANLMAMIETFNKFRAY